ncbi:MAG: zinc ribbon domain-containing protein, partial [Actinomycetota bacterium]
MSSPAFCTNCGSEFAGGAAFCTACGAAVSSDPRPPAPPPGSGPVLRAGISTGAKIGLIGLTVALAAGGTWLIA